MNKIGHQRQHFEFADFRLYPNERLLTKNNVRVALTPRILDVLIVLVEHDGELVGKETLLSAVWADSFVEEGNLSRAISTLRKNLGAQSNGSNFIETVPKLGYRFIAPVHRTFRVHPKPALVRKFKPGRRAFLLVAAFVFLAVGGSYLGYFSSRKEIIGGLTNLTNNLAEDNLPAWSPDGAKITFTSNRDGPGDIYLMNSDGSGVSRLTSTPAAESSSTWSPDGKQIVFDSERDGNREIYIMNSDGSNQTRLTFNPTADSGPVSFSPDGKRFAFSRNASSDGGGIYNYDIYVMNADGTGLEQLTTNPEFDAEPVWSPDGGRIFFTSARDGDFKIYVIDADGGGEHKLATNSTRNEGVFAFSPDGGQMFFTADTFERREFVQIYFMNADGTNRRQLTTFADKVYRVAYSQQAEKFAVSGKRDGNFEIYTLGAVGQPSN